MDEEYLRGLKMEITDAMAAVQNNNFSTFVLFSVFCFLFSVFNFCTFPQAVGVAGVQTPSIPNIGL